MKAVPASTGEAAPRPVRRRTTLHDVAGRAGVSISTVSRVLAGNYRASPATVARIHKAVDELDYVANAQARTLVGASSRLVAVLVSNVSTPFYHQIADAISLQVEAENRLCLLGTTGGDPGREIAMINKLREQSAEIVVLVGGVHDAPEYRKRIADFARSLDAEGARLVLCGRPAPEPGLPVTVVEYDGEGGAFAITSHLLSAGHRRILFLGGGAGSTTTVPRITGYERALEAHGLPLDPELIHHGHSTRIFGYEEMNRILDAGTPTFSAVFASDDLAAVGAMAALREREISVPDDISVVGFDDIPVAGDVVPALTTVRVPFEQIGKAAVEHALHRDDPRYVGRQRTVLGTHIVVRQSVKPLVQP